MVKLLIIAFILIININAKSKDDMNDWELHQYYLKLWNNFKHYQIDNAYMIFNTAAHDDLSWTAVAIALEESHLGRWQVSLNIHDESIDYDCGMFHNNTRSVLYRYNIPQNSYNHKEICTNLITDFNYGYINFVSEIKYWQKIHGSNSWRKIWASYNGGYWGNNKYSNRILIIIKLLKSVLDYNRIKKEYK